MEPTCAGCLQKLPKKEFLTCVLCKMPYDLECANVSSKRYYNTMSSEKKETWKCQGCHCNLPKTDNTNTPIRPSERELYAQSSSEKTNITIRKKSNINRISDISNEEISLLGDTINNENSSAPNLQLSEKILDNLSEIIHLRLQENNISIIKELKNTIQTEIHSAISKFREDMLQKTTELFKLNDTRKEEIETINIKIQSICEENEKLKKEMQTIENKINQENNTNMGSQNVSEIKNKRIVIYGLPEYKNEPEAELYNRLLEVFYDILNIDLTGYIEDTYRLGRNYNINRPLVVELLSKRMRTYLLEHKQYFKGTGLFISEFLDINEQKENKKMREEMFEARKKGYHAVIVNKKLYIDGKIVKKPEQDQNKENIDNNNENKRKSRKEQQASQFFRPNRPSF